MTETLHLAAAQEAEPINEDTSDRFGVGQRAIVERTDGRIEFDWKVVAHKDEGSVIVVEKYDKVTGKRLTKEIPRENLEATRTSFDDKLAQDLGDSALKTSGIEELAPSVEDGSEIEAGDPADAAKAEFDTFVESLNPGDRIGAWFYTVAHSDADREYALREKLSPGARANGVHLQYKELFDKMKQLKSDQQ